MRRRAEAARAVGHDPTPPIIAGLPAHYGRSRPVNAEADPQPQADGAASEPRRVFIR
jgi:hypothetical protein